MAESSSAALESLANREYRYGFVTVIEADQVPPGLNEEIVRLISAKKQEPEWLLEWRLRAWHRHYKRPRLISAAAKPLDWEKPVLPVRLLAAHLSHRLL